MSLCSSRGFDFFLERQWVASIAPDGCHVDGGRIIELKPSGYLQEEALIRAAMSKRQREFRSGRHFARKLLGSLGYCATEILARPDGDPIWPVGTCGSIAHSGELVLVIVGETGFFQGIGIDLEVDFVVDPEFRSLVCRPEEILQQGKFLQRGLNIAKFCFVAKEAFYKAIFPTSRRFLNFDQVYVHFDLDTNSFKCYVEDVEGCNSLRRAEGCGYFSFTERSLLAAFFIPA